MSTDIMFVNNIALFFSISQGLKFVSAKYIANRQHDTITACIKQLCSLYKLGGFPLSVIYSDKYLETLMAYMADIKIILYPAYLVEHVGDIERFIRSTKE